MSKYQDYGWNSAAPSNSADGDRLSDLFCALTKKLGNGLRVCDLGCGNGRMAALLADAGFRVMGVDASARGVAIARQHFPQAEFVCAELGAGLSALVGNEFDVVISSDVIEHLYRPGDLLEATQAVLKPKGYALIGTPYHGYWKNLAIAATGKMDNHFTALWDGGHIKFFSVATLGTLVRQHGFTVAGWHFYGRLPYLWRNMICHAHKGD
jgi:2-polyprenyl-3-methyl-5-hydroxy-6-metoxy-1,4-benzoquinol methylase